jgi:hypothetical protein
MKIAGKKIFQLPLALLRQRIILHSTFKESTMNGFDDFDTQVTAEEFYGDEDGEPEGSYDLSDDADALASAGFGTDEDYGYYGGEEW